ncbi:MAG TPA: HAD family hydrolase [Pirellulales bacterium]
MNRSRRLLSAVALTILITSAASRLQAAEPALASWNDGVAKQAIVDFVAKVTRPDSPDFVKPPARIAVFDNDGTLWCEQPVYVQAFYIIDRIKALAPMHPDWKSQQPFASILNDGPKALATLDEHALEALIGATHAGMGPDEFSATAKAWLKTAKHPKYERPYTELVYQPMLEVLAYLKAHDFKTFIVTGGGIEFVRAFAEETYGIPPEQVVGSSVKLKVERRNGSPVLVRLPEIGSIDDRDGKPVNIQLHIGRRPLMAFGNSDGDQAMLEWTTTADGPRFGLIVHHTDAEREYAYDRDSPIGRLSTAWDAAAARRWTVADMERDWKTVFAPAKASRVGD